VRFVSVSFVGCVRKATGAAFSDWPTTPECRKLADEVIFPAEANPIPDVLIPPHHKNAHNGHRSNSFALLEEIVVTRQARQSVDGNLKAASIAKFDAAKCAPDPAWPPICTAALPLGLCRTPCNLIPWISFVPAKKCRTHLLYEAGTYIRKNAPE